MSPLPDRAVEVWQPTVAVVIPCYNVGPGIAGLIQQIGPECRHILVVDDASQDGAMKAIERLADPRVEILVHPSNRGVGAAVKTGYERALRLGADVVVKLDGDGQMRASDIPLLVHPLATGQADYTKGNRFFDPDGLREMPFTRLMGNAALSFLTKLSSGYWPIFDPTNGFTAITSDALRRVPLPKIADRFFFESDLLFRLCLARAVVCDVALPAHYGSEKSNLRVGRVMPGFLGGNLRNFCKRLLYHYIVRDFSIASVELVIGSVLLLFGLIFGSAEWLHYASRHTLAPTGTIMLAALTVILGIQLLIAFLSYDIAMVPRQPITHFGRSPRRSIVGQ